MYSDPLTYFGLWPLFLIPDYVFPWFVYVITSDTANLDTLKKVTDLVIDVSAKHAPRICPVWKSDKSPILQYFDTNCY